MAAESAGSLACPNCGGPAAPEASACSFCRTPLALVACPACFAKVFRGAKHCPSCGATVARAESPSATGHRCPRCRQDLGARTVGAVALEECPACGGFWVAPASFQTIVSEGDQQALVLGTAFPAPEPLPGGAARDTVRYCPCPVCGQLMNRLNFAHCSGVIVDVCKPHGVWFDHDELRQIVAFLRGGGMDRAREQERQEMAEERRRLEAELARLHAAGTRLGGSGISIQRSREVLDLGDVAGAVTVVFRHLR